MTLPLETVMRYHDGELAAEERERVERVLGVDPEARAELQQLRQLGDLLRSSSRAAAFPDLADSVMAAVAEQANEQKPARRPRVLTLSRVVGGSAMLAAAAACLVLISDWVIGDWGGRASREAAEPQRGVEARPVAAGARNGLAAAAQPPGVAIESVEFGAASGAIFMVSAGDEAVPVVWLNDDWSPDAVDVSSPAAPELPGEAGRASPL